MNASSHDAGTNPCLPPWSYQSPAFLQLEIEHLFKRHWMFVAHISDLPENGDFTTFDAFDEQVLVIRGRDGELRAFHNVCKHRGGRVVAEESGHCRGALTCPFHGWGYDLDGRLLNVPALETFETLAVDQIALSPVELEIWYGFVFIRLVGGGPPVADSLSPVAAEVASYLPEKLEPLLPASVEVKPFNWKCIHDIDNEGYHVPVGHPSLNELYAGSYYDAIENGIMVARAEVASKPARNWSVRHYQQLLPEFAHLPNDRQRVWFYMMSFPNLVFGFYPDMMEIYMTLPDSVYETRYVSRTYALPDERPGIKACRFLNLRINNETAEEDDTYVGWLQQGMKSSAWEPPQLSSLEAGVAHYHGCIQRVLPVSRLAQAPQEQDMARINHELLDG